jgi:molybdopterin/thiamine biosynthesis adenylyltransferase/rhodanese-related sulfurtransferase
MALGRSESELPELTHDEILRYSRHLIIPEVGVAGQRRLRDARVLLVGAGGLGSPVALYLAAAGVGRLGIVDFDAVDVTNLQRQVLHGTKDVGRLKIASARDRLSDVNPHVDVVAHDVRLSSENALDLIGAYDLVVDGADNFPTRYLVNDACVLLHRPNVHASIFRFEGQCTVFCTADGPCYRCLYREPPPPGLVPSCAEGGVLGVLPGLLGVIQATEAVKLVIGLGEPLVGRLLLVDAARMHLRTVNLHRDPRCPACGTHELRALANYDQLCGAARHYERPEGIPTVTPEQLSERRRRGDDLDLIDVREPGEWEIARIEGARLAPLSSFARALRTIDSARDVVVYCKSGARSARAVRQLQAAGFHRVWNLEGGLLRWREDVDPTLPRY